VSWTPPEERRGIETMVEAVTIYYFCKGTDAAVRAALGVVRARIGQRGRIDLDESVGEESTEEPPEASTEEEPPSPPVRAVIDPALDAQFIALAEEMIAAWDVVPQPARVGLRDYSRASLSEVGAVAVAWGWTTRVVRTAQAALLLHRDGFDSELTPLLRSMLEHSIAIQWVVDRKSPAYQTLAREKADGWATFAKAQETGWTLEGAAA
jgi:hypothetical protein